MTFCGEQPPIKRFQSYHISALLKKSYLSRRKGHYSAGEGKINIFFNHSAREETTNEL
jgi:hypothetical protein